MTDEEPGDATSTDDALPTWGDLFARGEAVGATETEVRETVRGRRDG